MQNITILSTEIRQHDGLYSLNDLHKASGGAKKHQPALFMRLDQTQELIREIAHSTDMQSAIKTINGGLNRGTYACRELVIAYAAWISAAFHLKVIRVFLDAQKEEALPTPEQLMRQLWNYRLLVSFSYEGKMQVSVLKENDRIFNPDDLPKYIRYTGYDAPFSFPVVTEIAHAIADRMTAEADRWKGNYDGAVKRLKENLLVANERARA